MFNEPWDGTGNVWIAVAKLCHGRPVPVGPPRGVKSLAESDLATFQEEFPAAVITVVRLLDDTRRASSSLQVYGTSTEFGS